VILAHGLGNSRVEPEATTWSINAVAEAYLAVNGYAVLTYDARAHGLSGGLFSLDGPREVRDVNELFGWLASQPGVDRARIGGCGISYGGGAVWLAAAQGTPFAALAIVASWTDLGRSLLPQGLVKTGMIAGFLNAVPAERFAPDVLLLRNQALANSNIPGLRAFTATRSSLPLLGRLEAPTFLAQGRQDFAFDIQEAVAAYSRLRGPKRLYIGDLGHAPAANPGAEIPYYLGQARAWFDRFLKGVPNGIDTKPPVELAPDPWSPRTASYPALPPVRMLSFPLPGTRQIGPGGKVVRSTSAVSEALETFGSATVRVSVRPSGGFSRLTAALTARPPAGREILVSDGGVPLPSSGGTVTIRLLSTAMPIPRRSRLQLTLAAATTFQNPSNALYLDTPLLGTARLAIGPATLTVPVLRTRVSK
jgi:alpha-beta hydrolase superfamily lysophospholipase